MEDNPVAKPFMSALLFMNFDFNNPRITSYMTIGITGLTFYINAFIGGYQT